MTIVKDTTPPPAPRLVSPPDLTIAESPRPTFEWSRVTDPSGVTYSLQIDNDSDFSSLEVSRGGLEEIIFKLDTELAGGTFSWRVVAVDGAGNTADSRVNTFEVLGTPVDLTMLAFLSQPGTADYTPTIEWKTVTGDGVVYQVSLDSGPFREIGTGDVAAAAGDIRFTLTPEDSISFGPHHIFQVREVVTGSNIRGGVGSLFFSDNVTGGGSTFDAPLTITFPVDTDDFLPLGEHTIQVSGLDRLDNTSSPEDAQLLFKVSQLAIFFQPPATVVNAGQPATLAVQIEPRGVPVDGAEISIDFDTRLVFGGIVAAAGVTVADIQIGVARQPSGPPSNS